MPQFRVGVKVTTHTQRLGFVIRSASDADEAQEQVGDEIDDGLLKPADVQSWKQEEPETRFEVSGVTQSVDVPDYLM